MNNIKKILKDLKNIEENISLIRFENLQKEIAERLFANEVSPNNLWELFLSLPWEEQPSTDLNVKVFRAPIKCLAGAVLLNNLTEFDTIRIDQRNSIIPNNECHYVCDNVRGVYSDAIYLVLCGDDIDGYRFYNCYDEGTWLYAHQPIIKDLDFKDSVKVSKDIIKSKGISWVKILNKKVS